MSPVLPDSLTPEAVIRLFQGNAGSSSRLAGLLRRTFSACESSREQCHHLLPLFDLEPRAPLSHADLYLAHTRWQGQNLWNEWQALLPNQFGELRHRVRTVAEASRWGLAEALCEGSRKLASKDRALALRIAHLALSIAEMVPVDPLDSTARSELLALAHATIANALRAQDKVLPARRALDRALGYLEELPAHPLGLLPSVLSLKGSQEVWERDYSRALQTFAQALEHTTEDQKSLRARILIKRSYLKSYQENHASAAEDLHLATQLLDPEEDPHLWALAMLNRAHEATLMQRWDEAGELLPLVELRLQELADVVNLVRLRWTAARLARGKGRYKEAESSYQEAREGFLRHQLPYAAALVTLELAHLLFEQGRLEQVKQYALETAAEFERQGVEPELVGALALLEKAVNAQRLTVQLLERIRRSVERRNRP